MRFLSRRVSLKLLVIVCLIVVLALFTLALRVRPSTSHFSVLCESIQKGMDCDQVEKLLGGPAQNSDREFPGTVSDAMYSWWHYPEGAIGVFFDEANRVCHIRVVRLSDDSSTILELLRRLNEAG